MKTLPIVSGFSEPNQGIVDAETTRASEKKVAIVERPLCMASLVGDRIVYSDEKYALYSLSSESSRRVGD